MNRFNRALCGSARRWTAVAVAACSLWSASEARAQFVVAGWSAGRGGAASDVQNGFAFAKLRDAMVSSYGPVTFIGYPILTTPLLTGIDLLVLGAATDYGGGNITPLASFEQAALQQYLNNGGKLLIVTDNRQYLSASQSLVSPLGLTSDGTIDAAGDGLPVFSGSACVLTNGLFGPSVPFDATRFNGWYPSTSGWDTLATWGYNGQACIVSRSFGTAGRAVCVSEYGLIDSTEPGAGVLLKDILNAVGARPRTIALPPLVPCSSPDVALSLPAGLNGAGFRWQRQEAGVWADLADGSMPSGALVTGSGTSAMTITSIKDVDSASFRCRVTLACGGSVTSGAQFVEVIGGCCPCVADFDASGGTPDSSDIVAFFGAWLAGDMSADSDCSGGTPDSTDIDVFFNEWLAGGC